MVARKEKETPRLEVLLPLLLFSRRGPCECAHATPLLSLPAFPFNWTSCESIAGPRSPTAARTNAPKQQMQLNKKMPPPSSFPSQSLAPPRRSPLP